MKKGKINWDKAWKSFNRWFDNYAKDFLWETQRDKIEQIIEKQLNIKDTK